MKQVLASQLAEWIDSNTKGFSRRHGNIIYIEGKIDAYELARYALSLIDDRSTEQIQANNRAVYTGRSVNVSVEGADFTGV
jgi:glycine cleavage system regulatory protein